MVLIKDGRYFIYAKRHDYFMAYVHKHRLPRNKCFYVSKDSDVLQLLPGTVIIVAEDRNTERYNLDEARRRGRLFELAQARQIWWIGLDYEDHPDHAYAIIEAGKRLPDDTGK